MWWLERKGHCCKVVVKSKVGCRALYLEVPVAKTCQRMSANSGVRLDMHIVIRLRHALVVLKVYCLLRTETLQTPKRRGNCLQSTLFDHLAIHDIPCVVVAIS
jgi:hypothetical protein